MYSIFIESFMTGKGGIVGSLICGIFGVIYYYFCQVESKPHNECEEKVDGNVATIQDNG